MTSVRAVLRDANPVPENRSAPLTPRARSEPTTSSSDEER